MSNEEFALPITIKQYECLDCMFRSTRMSNWTAHLHTQKHRINMQHQHVMTSPVVELPPESRMAVYNCSVCNFKFCNTIAWKRHIQSKRHIKLTQLQLVDVVDVNLDIVNTAALCGRSVMSSSTIPVAPSDPNNELILCLIEQYKQLKETVLHQGVAIISTIKDAPVHHPPPQPILVQNNFNLNFFLNDTCKDALNISDFIESVEINISDLLRTAEQGYVDGITNILLNRLNELEVHERPIHCTDSKRDIIYIKDKNCWEREQHDKPKLKNAIIQVSNKNIQLIPEWQKIHPEYKNLDTVDGQTHLVMMVHALGGSNHERTRNTDKIIKNVAKSVTVSSERRGKQPLL